MDKKHKNSRESGKSDNEQDSASTDSETSEVSPKKKKATQQSTAIDWTQVAKANDNAAKILNGIVDRNESWAHKSSEVLWATFWGIIGGGISAIIAALCSVPGLWILISGFLGAGAGSLLSLLWSKRQRAKLEKKILAFEQKRSELTKAIKTLRDEILEKAGYINKLKAAGVSEERLNDQWTIFDLWNKKLKELESRYSTLFGKFPIEPERSIKKANKKINNPEIQSTQHAQPANSSQEPTKNDAKQRRKLAELQAASEAQKQKR